MSMKKAFSLSEIPNAFRADPLREEQLAEFYEDTIEARTGVRGKSGIEDIYEACRDPQEHNAHLLMGHMGCGKSTELNRLAMRLRDEGFCVRTIFCKQELDVMNIDFSDVMLLLAEVLLDMADAASYSPNASDLRVLQDYQAEIVRETKMDLSASTALEAGVEVKTPALLKSLLSGFARIKSSLKYNESSSTTVRQKITSRISEWIAAINRIADGVTAASCSHQPIIIFEDLDKGDTGRVFSGHGEQLTAMNFPLIYTFPIARSYLPEFASLESFFQIHRLPMIEIRHMDGTRNEDGFHVIRSIAKRRADLSLFAKRPDVENQDVLDYMIEKTGGSLRNLFFAIGTAATLSRRRGETQITLGAAADALEDLKSSLSIRIDGRDYPFLVEIVRGKHRGFHEREQLQRLMQAGAVLEYNGIRWHDVHPLIVDFLQEIGEIA